MLAFKAYLAEQANPGVEATQLEPRTSLSGLATLSTHNHQLPNHPAIADKWVLATTEGDLAELYFTKAQYLQ
jgi:hypothetical protein